MSEAFSCYITCLWGSGAGYLIMMIFIGLMITIALFVRTFRPEPFLAAQASTSFIIILGFLGMNCYMISYVWLYLAIVLGALIILGLLNYGFKRHLVNITCPDDVGPDLRKELVDMFGCEVRFIDHHVPKAFAHANVIYLSIGLIEALNDRELKAVVAHEAFHINFTPDRTILVSMAILSLWFRSFRDEKAADWFAAEMIDRHSIISAMEKLDIKGREERIAALS